LKKGPIGGGGKTWFSLRGLKKGKEKVGERAALKKAAAKRKKEKERNHRTSRALRVKGHAGPT